MARRGVKKQDHERLDDKTVGLVASLLEDNSITKKEACERLNINYNTARLNKIIQEYKDNQEYRAKRYKMNRGKPFSDLELKELIVDYLSGESISAISDRLFRSTHVIKAKIKDLHLPERTKTSDYFHPELIPDEAVSEDFSVRELVWSARYNCVAEIRKKYPATDKYETYYSIWVFGKHNEFAHQPWWELGKLEALKNLQLKNDEFVKTEKPNFAYRID